MIKDIWEEMPKFTDYGSVMWEEHGVATEKWLKKLKVEYDDMKQTLLSIEVVKVKVENEIREKAGKWDKLETSELLHDIIVNASKLEAVRAFAEDCWSDKLKRPEWRLEGGTPLWVLERLDSILGTKHGKILEAES